jgi:putative ABC transport system substrate-binding protein
MQFDRLKRRDFITLVGGAAAAWPLAARAQQADRVRRIGILMGYAEGDPETEARLAAFRQRLERRGWSEGRNVNIEARFAGSSPDRYQPLATELVALQPDVILAHTTMAAVALQRETRTIPIIFVNVSDPIGAGFVASLARPGGNLTGILHYEAGIVGKWLALLKEIAPRVTHVAVMGNPRTTPFDYFLRAAEAVAPSLAITLTASTIETTSDIERSIGSFANASDRGLLFAPDGTAVLYRDLIIALAARYRLPAVYPFDFFVPAGGLISYGTNQIEMFRQTVNYVDRVLRGAKAGDLPVQVPTKYETAINLKTAAALGLTVSNALLVAADELIE